MGVSALFTAISGFCFRKYSTQLNQLRQTHQDTGNLPFKKFWVGLSFIASTVATGLSTGALVTTLTGGSDFGMSLIIGGVSGLVAGLLGLLVLGSHGHNQYHGGMTPASA